MCGEKHLSLPETTILRAPYSHLTAHSQRGGHSKSMSHPWIMPYSENTPRPLEAGAPCPSPPCPRQSVPQCESRARPPARWIPWRAPAVPPGTLQTAAARRHWTAHAARRLGTTRSRQSRHHGRTNVHVTPQEPNLGHVCNCRWPNSGASPSWWSCSYPSTFQVFRLLLCMI